MKRHNHSGTVDAPGYTYYYKVCGCRHLAVTLRALVVAVVIAICVSPAFAQTKKHGRTSADRERWEAEMVKYRHDYFTRELDLKEDQQTRFFALYDAMERERRTMFNSVRAARRALDKKGAPTDAEYLQVVQLDLDTDRKVKDVERKYFEEYRKVLTPKQLYKLRDAEFNLMHKLRKHASATKKK